MKKYSKILLICMLFIISLFCFVIPKSYAGEMATYAHKSYDTIMEESASSLIGKKFTDYLGSGDDDFRKKCNRFLCLEKPSVTSWQNFYIYSVIDINGASPRDMEYTSSSGTKTKTSDYALALAYISAQAEMNDNDNGSYSYSKAYSRVMNNYLRSVLDPGMPYGTDDANTTVYQNALAYMNDYLAGSTTEVYSARIIVFHGGAMQTTAILYGKVGENEEVGEISVNKYISNKGSRSTYSENTKKKNPETFGIDSTVTYTIELTNTYPSERTVTITDTFEGSGSYGGLKISSYSGWTKNSNTSYSKSVTIPGGGSQTVTLSVKTYSNVKEDLTSYEETYMNKVEVTGTDVVISKEESADYVKVGLEIEQEEEPDPSGTLVKYISAVNGHSVGGRSNLSNDEKEDGPQVVEKGDIVEYTIIVKNTSELDIYNANLRDTLEDGLTEYSGFDTLEDFSIDAGDEYETQIYARVDKSNLYLPTLENEVIFLGADYTREITYTYTCLAGCSHEFTIEIPDVSIPSSIVNDINDSDMNKDFVRLKELTIAGYVWLEDAKIDGYKKNETALEGIDVILHETTDGDDEVLTTITDSSGYYSFSGFYKGTDFVNTARGGYYPDSADHRSYYVEFRYNGVTYEPTNYIGTDNIQNLDTKNKITENYKTDSNAREFTDERDDFNNSLETISYNKGTGSSGSKTLAFDKSGHISTLKTTDDVKMSSYSFVTDPDKEKIKELFFNENENTGETEYLEYINLGLVERDKVDLSITKDFYSAQVRVNEHTMNYDYNLLTSKTLYENPNDYKLYIYESDYDYRYDMYKNDAVVQYKKDKNTELEIDLTYRIRVYNESPDPVYAKVNEVIDFNSDKMTFKNGTAYMEYDGSKINLAVSSSSSYNTTSDYNISGYETKFITGTDGVVLSNTGTNYFDIYITYTVDKDSSRAIYLGEKINVAQIGAYSTYENSSCSEVYGLVDIDSNAGNVTKNTSRNDVATITDTSDYDDNTCRVLVDLELKKNERTISGMVFEDARSVEINGSAKYFTDKNSGENRNYTMFTGDGSYNGSTRLNINDRFKQMIRPAVQDVQNDTPLGGMTVQLVEVIEVAGKLYEETIDPTGRNKVVVRTATTGDSGKYIIESYIPGTYLVRFKYGDILNNQITTTSLVHNGQDYKSTSYKLGIEESTDNDTKISELIKDKLSDARDNEFRRVEIMSASEVMVNEMAEFLKYTNYTSQADRALTNSDSVNKFSQATSGFADTVTVTLGVEEKEKTLDKAGTLIENPINKKTLTASLPNIDFGLVFRPENMIKLEKKIKNINLKTSAGEVLVDIEYDMNGKILSEVGGHNVQGVNNTNNVQGFRYINVDEDVLQGATLAVEYYLVVNNVGEVDIVNELLIKEEGSAAVLSKLNNVRNVIQSVGGTITYDNYVRLNDLFKAAGYGETYEYGLFLSDRYYKGDSGNDTNAAIVTLRVNKILDFIDNDASFLQINNNIKNKYWGTTTEVELLSAGLINSGSLIDSYYIDKQGRRYTTDTKNNLVINVSTENENGELVKNIIPEIAKNAGTKDSDANIVIQMDAILAGDNASEDMVYDNVAEVIEFYTPAGRRTNFATTIGNLSANDNGGIGFDPAPEPDTYTTEVIRLTPPTGLTRMGLFISGNQNTIIIITIIVMALAVIYVIKASLHGKVGKSKVYR